MKTQVTLQELLRWRLAQAETEAPPPLRASQLLTRLRPWWETWPEHFQRAAERLRRLEIAYGHAMAESRRTQVEYHLIPAVISRNEDELETTAQLLHFSVRDGQVRLRFQLNSAPESIEHGCEATFVSRDTERALFAAPASASIDNEYTLTAELPENLAIAWQNLKVTDPMPFRLILRQVQADG